MRKLKCFMWKWKCHTLTSDFFLPHVKILSNMYHPSIVSNCFIPFMGSPAYHRALTDGRGPHVRCQPHVRSNLGFSNLLKDTLTCSSVQPGGKPEIWTSDLRITSQPATCHHVKLKFILWKLSFICEKKPITCENVYIIFFSHDTMRVHMWKHSVHLWFLHVKRQISHKTFS